MIECPVIWPTEALAVLRYKGILDCPICDQPMASHEDVISERLAYIEHTLSKALAGDTTTDG